MADTPSINPTQVSARNTVDGVRFNGVLFSALDALEDAEAILQTFAKHGFRIEKYNIQPELKNSADLSLDTPYKVAPLHYSPVVATLFGERPVIRHVCNIYSLNKEGVGRKAQPIL